MIFSAMYKHPKLSIPRAGFSVNWKTILVQTSAVGENTQQRPAWIGRTFVFAGISP